MIAIRPKRAGDVSALLAIWRRAVDATHGFLSAEDRAALEPLVEVYLDEAELKIAVDASDRALGFAGATGANIDSLFVDPEAHRSGVGRALVASFPSAVTVDVNEQNEGAVRFYERLGFEVAGRSPLDDQGRPYPLLHLRKPPRAP